MIETRPETRNDYSRRIGRVLAHIQERLDETLLLEELAAVAHFSPFHFHRVFRGMVGESVMQHVRRLRLERAAMRLRHTDRAIVDIAFEAGYENHESFTRAFRSAFGRPPSAFREEKGFGARVESPASVHFSGGGAEVTFTPMGVGQEPLDVSVRRLDPERVAFMRHVGPFEEVGETWERLMEWAGTEGLLGPRTRFFGACYDDPEVTPADKIRYDACVTVDSEIAGDGEIGVQTITGGRFAVTLHEGPYEALGDTCAALFGRWFAGRDHEPGDPPCLEFYLNDPDCTEPEGLLTEIWVRIRDETTPGS